MNTEDGGAQLSEEVILDAPIKRGDQEIDRLRVRKPQSGELRGLSLRALLEQDVDQVRQVLPRVAMPSITAHEVDGLDPADLLALGAELSLFFLQKADRPASRKG